MADKDNEQYQWHNRIDEKAPKLTTSEQVADASIWLVAENLLGSHLFTCTKNAWRYEIDLILWIDYPWEALDKHPELKKVNRASLIGEETHQRGFRYWEIQGYKFALSPAMNSFRLFEGPLWSELGLSYKEEIFPFLSDQPIRYLEVDWRKTLAQPFRQRILVAVDKDHEFTDNIEDVVTLKRIAIPATPEEEEPDSVDDSIDNDTDDTGK